MSDITIPVNGGDLPVFAAVPEPRAPWPGVVVLHDVGGLKEDIRNQARWLAHEGFLAAAPNLYFRGPMMKCVFALARDLKARRGRTYDDVEAVRSWLVRHARMHRQDWRDRVLHGRRDRSVAGSRVRIRPA
jgi:carboxymethylenebutenolidase